MISGMDLNNYEKRSGFGLGSAFFGISDPGLVKKTFFKVSFHEKLTGGPGDEILKMFVLCAFLWGGTLKKVSTKSRSDGCGEAGGEVPPSKKSQGSLGV